MSTADSQNGNDDMNHQPHDALYMGTQTSHPGSDEGTDVWSEKDHRQIPSPYVTQLPLLSASDNNPRQARSRFQRDRATLNPHPRFYPFSSELRLTLSPVSVEWGTLELYNAFARHGNIVRIEVYRHTGSATISFRPPPARIDQFKSRMQAVDEKGVVHNLRCSYRHEEPRHQDSPTSKRRFPEYMSLPLHQIEFGVKEAENKMLVLYSALPDVFGTSALTLELLRKAMDITFTLQLPEQGSTAQRSAHRLLRLRVLFAQMKEIFYVPDADGTFSLVFSLDYPPLVFRKSTHIQSTHDGEVDHWHERSAWYRQTNVDLDPTARDTPIQLQPQGAIIDIGRWLTYRIKLTQQTVHTDFFKDFCLALADHNVNIITRHDLKFNVGQPEKMWDWSPKVGGNHETGLHEMTDDTVHLPFPVRYQLEVCLSHGILHECQITQCFLQRLTTIKPRQAILLLEKAADTSRRMRDSDEIMALQGEISKVKQKRPPSHCVKIPAAVVTPTTIYFSTPVLETSNRVIRQFNQFQDRFLRVKFTDERYWGRIMTSFDHSMDEVLSRVMRTLTHGINIGDRHYEFLACGNSQFREHGAYFFAPTPTLTAADIRNWMGNFTSIKVIAKYASRIGQCFSTTRAIGHSVAIERIPDVERNGFCFTDGVGKISPFLAQMVGIHYGLDIADTPSVFQFRLAGCKGVLAVDPSLKACTIQIRPSQEKFPATYHGLEICRLSQFSTASLNMQLILVLSALGVPDGAFVSKLRAEMADLEEAMTNEVKADTLLQKRIDYNQTTLTLSRMIHDGFMQSKDPFMLSCLRLWRSWSHKYLKEKARIYIDQGAFVLGTIDETCTLKGHFDMTSSPRWDNEVILPEIFLQIPNTEHKGQFRIVKGICTLARNPSLHPGDVRVVRAVDVPALHHLKNCVVLPQTGDRDLANMCSGGDLDGDDYLVLWDNDILPREWNHKPMDYTSPTPEESSGPVKVSDLTKFFVNHIKNDNLGRIATAHRYWADQLPNGVKEEACLQLAQLHSKAVDYAKTGIPAEMPPRLRINRWPHWASVKNKSRVYHSNKILGQLYDEVQRVPFEPAWGLPFDARILDTYQLDAQVLADAREVKQVYDETLRRIMAQFGIESEFEVVTTFVLQHHSDIGDYKFSEVMGEVAMNLREQHQELCYEKAGTTSRERDWIKLGPFIAAMYTVTSHDVRAATQQYGGPSDPLRPKDLKGMPLISFPWIFPHELGVIASSQDGGRMAQSDLFDVPPPELSTSKRLGNRKRGQELADLRKDEKGNNEVPPLIQLFEEGLEEIMEGDVLDLFHQENSNAALEQIGELEQSEETSATTASEAVPSTVDIDEIMNQSGESPSATEGEAGPTTEDMEEARADEPQTCPKTERQLMMEEAAEVANMLLSEWATEPPSKPTPLDLAEELASRKT